MPTRTRRPGTLPTQRRATVELPTYETPAFPLNAAAQRALSQLHHHHDLAKLDTTLLEAQKALTNGAADMNDRLTSKASKIQKQRDKQAAKAANAANGANGANGAIDPELEQSLEDFGRRVDSMTKKMDEYMQKMIDGQHSVQSMQASLAQVSEEARGNAGTLSGTQPARSQRQTRQRADDNGEDSDEYQYFEPTAPPAATQDQRSTKQAFESKMDDAKTRYQSYSRTARYAENNQYRGFRRHVHDAQHPEGDVPLAHYSEWFQEGEAPAPGVTTRLHAHGQGDEDDIAISRATISTKCPLTLQEFKEPLKSQKCPHSFEAEAIRSMINNSPHRMDNLPNGARFVQCPVPGCDQVLTKVDLETDDLLVRQIKRIQRARELEAQEAEEDEAHGGSQPGQRLTVIEDDDDTVEDRVVPQTQTKQEPKSSTRLPPTSNATSRRTAGVSEIDNDSEDGVGAHEEDMMDTD